jgi:hypothetical protein
MIREILNLDNLFLAGIILLSLAGLVIVILNYSAERWEDDDEESP